VHILSVFMNSPQYFTLVFVLHNLPLYNSISLYCKTIEVSTRLSIH
jgi:hypothetical protein